MPHKLIRATHLLAVLCCLILVLAACGQQTSSGTSGGQTPEIPEGASVTPGRGTTPTPASTSTITTQTSCPPAGTARAVIMPPLTTERHANIVYVFQSFSPYQYQGSTYQDSTSFLKRYDVTSGAKAVIATFPHSSIASSSATISPDGQWIMFETYIEVHPLAGYDDNTMLQLVRIDGQYLQTLNCATGSPLAATFPVGFVGATRGRSSEAVIYRKLGEESLFSHSCVAFHKRYS